ncbi:hypothetical protein FHX52_2996 [Humibacillus xanthopallidus]|uniref:Methyltransferase family protein n=1 Tax=Humibacillus xanthopallidus TaxID=412689 RepID=A0A543PQE5_9MICO|nr:hypothetical protein FHX52_2996 [Humibacillus xanthopallidus]
MELVAPFMGDYPTSVLDVGCGTGRVLGLGLTTPDRYAGVDPSQPMLNMLVRKYPSVARITSSNAGGPGSNRASAQTTGNWRLILGAADEWRSTKA